MKKLLMCGMLVFMLLANGIEPGNAWTDENWLSLEWVGFSLFDGGYESFGGGVRYERMLGQYVLGANLYFTVGSLMSFNAEAIFGIVVWRIVYFGVGLGYGFVSGHNLNAHGVAFTPEFGLRFGFFPNRQFRTFLNFTMGVPMLFGIGSGQIRVRYVLYRPSIGLGLSW